MWLLKRIRSQGGDDDERTEDEEMGWATERSAARDGRRLLIKLPWREGWKGCGTGPQGGEEERKERRRPRTLIETAPRDHPEVREKVVKKIRFGGKEMGSWKCRIRGNRERKIRGERELDQTAARFGGAQALALR